MKALAFTSSEGFAGVEPIRVKDLGFRFRVQGLWFRV
jgi:hypothetical protein